MQDIRFTYKDDTRAITVHISRSKTDQLGVGCFMTLSVTDRKLCPVTATADYPTRINWNSKSGDSLFSETMRGRLHALTKWPVSCDGLETSRCGVRSIRSGGATACYVDGVPLGDIRRFGRWKSCVLHRYIHHDELMCHGLSRRIARTEGFLEQLKQTNSVTKALGIDESSERAEFRTGRDGWGAPVYPSFRTGGRRISDSESESGNIANWDIDAPPVGKSYHSVFTREVVETTTGNEPTP